VYHLLPVISKCLREPLLGVSLDAPRDGWAVGYLGTFVHYDGNTWSTIPGPAHFNQSLFGIAMLSPMDGWAVGNSGSILHYNGRQWLPVSSPTQFDLRSIAMPSPQEGWAVGVNGTILHYQNGSWRVSRSPTRNTLNNISMLSPDEGWAVGEQDTILHYRAEDGVWEQVYSAGRAEGIGGRAEGIGGRAQGIGGRAQGIAPTMDGPGARPAVDPSARLYGVAMSSIRSGWVIGEHQLLTYNSEVWSVPGNLPTFAIKAQSSVVSFDELNLYSIALSHTGEGWAVGSTDTYGSDVIIILHQQSGAWSASLIVS
jgi:hypothetical protein